MKHRLIALLPTLAGLLLALVGAAVCTLTEAATPAAAAGFDNAWAQFNRATGGDSAAIKPAAEAFEGLLKAEPANPLLLAYAGASKALQATTVLAPMDKLAFAEDGLALLDKALALLAPAHDQASPRGVPVALEVRFVAANTFLAMPAAMNRGARGNRLLNEVLASPLLANAAPGFRDAVRRRAAAVTAPKGSTP
jgi:hypothetical protein